MAGRSRVLIAGGVVALVAALAVAVSVAAGGGDAAKPKKIEFNIMQVEFKGGTSTDKLAPPARDPGKLSDGYELKGPGVADPADPKRWEVSSYGYSPASMTACKGDTVALRFFIVNGDKHKDWVEAPNGQEVVKETVHERGREYVVNFRASQVGNYRLICNIHEPTMKANIRILPASACA